MKNFLGKMAASAVQKLNNVMSRRGLAVVMMLILVLLPAAFARTSVPAPAPAPAATSPSPASSLYLAPGAGGPAPGPYSAASPTLMPSLAAAASVVSMLVYMGVAAL